MDSDIIMETHGFLPTATKLHQSILLSGAHASVLHQLHCPREHVKCLYWKSTTHDAAFPQLFFRARAPNGQYCSILFYSACCCFFFFARATYFGQSVLLSYTALISLLQTIVCVLCCTCVFASRHFDQSVSPSRLLLCDV